MIPVPADHHGFRRFAFAGRWTVLEPGIRFRIPLLQRAEILDDAVRVTETLQVETREGVAAEVHLDVRGRVSQEALAAMAADPGPPSGFVRREAGRLLLRLLQETSGGQVVSGAADARIARALEAALGRIGLRETTITASGSRAGPAVAEEQSRPRRSLEHPVVVIGLDGADWQIAGPLIEAGRLPNLARLRDGGLWGHLRSDSPMLSPLLWTTAATGKRPVEHGIVDFLVRDPETGKKIPIASNFRRVRALWNIFAGRELTSSFVAWWATYPAEPVPGVEMISDRVAYSLFGIGDVEGAGDGLVHPPDLWPAVRDRKLALEELEDRAVLDLVRVEPERIQRAKLRSREEDPDASKDRLVHLLKILASTRTYHDIALDILDRGQPDLLGVYYQMIDEVCHRFMHCMPPALSFCEGEDSDRYGGTVAAAYEYQDRLLGDLLSRIDPGSYVVLLSDHGFRSGGDRPRDVAADIEGKPAKWHRLYGVFLVAGPGVSPGRLDHVTLLDIAPTILRLAGLPRAEDMEGRILVEPDAAPRPPAAIASYENEGAYHSGSVQVAGGGGAGEEAMLENLRSLGYIGGEEARDPSGETGSGSGSAAPEPGTLTSHGNMGSLYLQNGDLAGAAREFEAALRINPVYFPALMGLVEVRVQEGRHEEAYELARRGMERSRSPEPGVYVRYAGLAADLGREVEARGILEAIGAERTEIAEIHIALAVLAHHEKRFGESEGQILRALEKDPANGDAVTRLLWLRRREGREQSLMPFLRRALEINSTSVLHLNLLGLLLERQGDPLAAEREFRKALETAPDFGGTMANLGALYGRSGRLEEAISLLGRALEIEPQNLMCRVNLGAALGKLGRTGEALQVLRAGQEMYPSRPELMNALAVAYAHSGNEARAEELLRESLSIRPEQPHVRSMLQELTAPR